MAGGEWHVWPASGTNSEANLQPHSCVLCKQRKVKCDRIDPRCSNCEKANAECIYRAPDPPRRRKRKLSGPDLQARLKQYEELLESHGIPVDDSTAPQNSTENKAQKSTQSKTRDDRVQFMDGGLLYEDVEQGLKREADKYKKPYGSSDLLNEINELQSDPRHESSWREEDEHDEDHRNESYEHEYEHNAADFLMGQSGPPGPMLISTYLPSYDVILKLWETYKTNVDPIIKMIHVPTTEKLISKGTNSPESLSRTETTLFFSILAAAMNSLTPSQFLESYEGDRSAMLETLRRGTRQALSQANFLGTWNFTVLQAFCIYIMSMRGEFDHPSLWSMTGVAIRIGLRLGLDGKNLEEKSTPFEAEIKRRLWLQLLIYDAQIGELSGSTMKWGGLVDNIQPPANLNDEDFGPETKELPPEKEGATEVIFTVMRYDFAKMIRRMGLYQDPSELINRGPELKEEQERAFQEMEELFLNKYLRHCDPLVPIQFMVTLAGRAMISRLRLLVAHPRQYTDRGASLPQEELDRLFDLSLKTLEYESVACSTKSLERFWWHVSLQVQYTSLVFVLSELRKRTSGPEVEKAWKRIEDIYDSHPELIDKGYRRFFWSLGSLVVGTWQTRELDHERKKGAPLTTPGFIQKLREQRGCKGREKVKLSSTVDTPGTNSSRESIGPIHSPKHGFPPLPQKQHAPKVFGILPFGMEGDWQPDGFSMGFDPFGHSPLNWSDWDQMLMDCERQGM